MFVSKQQAECYDWQEKTVVKERPVCGHTGRKYR